MVMMFVGCGGDCVGARRNSHTIPTVKNVRGGIFCSRPNPYGDYPVKTKNEARQKSVPNGTFGYPV